MVSAHSRRDGRCYRARICPFRSVRRLGGLAVAFGVLLAVATAPGVAWADPLDDTNVATEPAGDGPTDEQIDSEQADSDGGGAAKAPTSVGDPAGGESSQTEVTVGDGGPEVTIRYSGGSVADGSTPGPPQPAEEPSEVATAPAHQEPVTPAEPAPTETAEVASVAEEPEYPADPAADAAHPAHAPDPALPDALRLEPLGTGFGLVANDAQPLAPSVVPHIGSAAATNSRALNAPITTAGPFDPIGGLFDAPDGLLSAATALLSNVLNVLFVPTPGGTPPDSPIVWAVLGLVRRQFNSTANVNPALDPRQTSRGLDGDAQTFTVVTDHYAYVLNRDTNSVTVMDIDTNEVVEVRAALDQLVGPPVASPDGSRLFVTNAQNGGVYAIDAAFGSTVDIDDATAQSDPIIAGGYSGPNDYYVPNGTLAFSADGTLLYVSRQHAHVVSGLFLPAVGDVVVVGNDPSDPATYLKVIGDPIVVAV